MQLSPPGLSKEYVQGQGPLWHLIKKLFFFYIEQLLATRSTPESEEHALLAVRNCLLNTFAATLHPKPEDLPRHGDKGSTEHGQLLSVKFIQGN
jgi:hypothetical protein